MNPPLQWKLPGVFSESKYGLNGSLWSLPYEAICYLYIAIFCGLGLFSFRFAANVLLVVVVATAFLAPQYLPRFGQNPISQLLPACFALGALFSINKAIIKIDFKRVILLWIFAALINEPKAYSFFFYIAFFYTAIFIASLKFVNQRLKLPFDASYGVYIYGFLIQQCVHSVFPNVGVHGNQLISIVLALPIAILSWYLVEKPAIDFGVKLTSSHGLGLAEISPARSVVHSVLFVKYRPRFKEFFSVSLVLVVTLGLLSLALLDFSSERKLSEPHYTNQASSAFALNVINWGPRSAKIGTYPNLQSDGSMGVWIEVSGTQGLGEAQVVFDGQPAKLTVVTEKLITAAIVTEHLGRASSKEVLVKQISSGKVFPVGAFIIEPGK